MKLDKEEYRELQQALLSAFPDKSQLEQMVRLGLNENLYAIAGGETLKDLIFDLIKWAESKGKLEELIWEAHQANPDNFELKDFYQKINCKLRLLILIKTLDEFKLQFNKEYNSAYQQCLLHKELKINISYDLDKFLEENIRILEEHKDDEDNRFSLLDCFVGYLKLNIKNQSSQLSRILLAWLNYDHDDLMLLIQQKQELIEENKRNSNPCLLVVFRQVNNEKLQVESWIINNVNQKNNCEPLNKEKILIELQNFPKIFREIYENSLKFCKDKKLNSIEKIKVFLPYNLIECKNIPPIDTLTIKEECPAFIIPDTFGKQYEVILEFSERLTMDHYVSKWEKKRKVFDRELNTIENILQLKEINDLQNLYITLDPENILGIRFVNTVNIQNVMTVLFYTGVPFALWVRQDIPELNITGELDNICRQESCLENFSNIIKDKRYQAWRERNYNHLGNHLSLLWDTDNLLPPK